jgi:hypothetical protein
MFDTYFLKSRMRQLVQTPFPGHPAVPHVQNCGETTCLVLFGLPESDTLTCLNVMANTIIHNGGLAKTFSTCKLEEVLKSLGCRSIYEFTQNLPGPAWLMFDGVVEEDKYFIQHLISHSHSKFRLIVSCHTARAAKAVLGWVDFHMAPVHPIDCCRWHEADLRRRVPDDTLEACIRAGCPGQSSMDSADELAARWALGVQALEDFLANTWHRSGCFVDGGIESRSDLFRI